MDDYDYDSDTDRSLEGFLYAMIHGLNRIGRRQ